MKPGPELIARKAKELFPEVLRFRRHLHRHPELSFKEKQTSAFIGQELKRAGIPFKSGFVGTGIVALIEGKNPAKKVILLRGDMDALPIQEKNKVPYCSIVPGVMHACGHDVHSACVLGTAILLNSLKEHFEGTIKVMFQPGEELLPGGASLMIAEGVLENPPVDQALALHVFPSMEAGNVGFRSGMYMASTDELYITVNGRGGHAAMVNEYVSPLVIASELILDLNKHFQPGNLKGTRGEGIPTVVAFGKIEGLGATNVIPDKVEMAGTCRTFNEEWRNEIHERLRSVVSGISSKYGINSEIRIEKGYPFLVNDGPFTNQCRDAAKEFLGPGKVHPLETRMTAEDFAFISQKVPSCFFRLGTGNSAKGITSGVHTPTFNIDEAALETGVGTLSWILLKALS